MRLHSFYQLILLLCAFAAADATAKCDRSLITGVTDDQIYFDYPNNELRCRKSENSLMAIQFASKLYTFLVCDENNGWKEGGDDDDEEMKNDWIADASAPLAVKCVEYCVWTGREGWIDSHKNEEWEDFIRISCINSAHKLHHHRGVMGKEIKCSIKSGWETSESYFEYFGVTNDISSTQHFECMKPPPCSFFFNEAIHFDNETKTLTCSGLMDISYDLEEYASLKCEDTAGWMDGSIKIAESHIPLHVYCVEYCAWSGTGISSIEGLTVNVTCPDDQLYYGDEHIPGGAFCGRYDGWIMETYSDKIKMSSKSNPLYLVCRRGPPCTVHSTFFDSRTNFDQLTCRQYGSYNSLMAIEYNSTRFTSLKCEDPEGWKDGDKDIADAFTPLEVTCVEYCASTGSGIRYIEGLSVHVTCPDDQLYYGDQPMPGGASCKLNRGWVMTSSSDAIQWSITTPLHLECRQESTRVPTTVESSDDKKETATASDIETANKSSSKSPSFFVFIACGVILSIIVIIAIVGIVCCLKRTNNMCQKPNPRVQSERSQNNDKNYNSELTKSVVETHSEQ